MKTIRNQIIDNYIEKNYPNSKIVNYDDEESGLKFYTEEELYDLNDDWYPLCCYNKEEQVIFGGRDKVVHTYTVGETGCGKTTRLVMESIYALSSLKNKPSFLVVDIHGEIIENLSKHLINQGYNIKILNCDEPEKSDTYNPFKDIAISCLETKSLNYEAVSEIRKIANIICPIESKNDPIWDIGARSYVNGLILDKFEDLIVGNIPMECLTFYNIINNHYWLRKKVEENDSILKIENYQRKEKNALSIQKLIGITDNAERTRKSYYGVVENRLDEYGQPNLYKLSSSSTIDIDDFLEKPTIIVIQTANTSIGDSLISFLVNGIYNKVVKKCKKIPDKKLNRNVHLFLDEFTNSNIASGEEIVKMLTTSRKFGMFWHIILQSDEQIIQKYNSHIASIIRANCTEIYMGSNDYNTQARFAESCGKRTIVSLQSEINQSITTLEQVNLINTEDLRFLKEGHIYIKSSGYNLLYSFIEALYNTKNYYKNSDLSSIYPKNDYDYKKTYFYPYDIPLLIYEREFKLIQYLRNNSVSTENLCSKCQNIEEKRLLNLILSDLKFKNIIDYKTKNTKIKLLISNQTYSIYQLRDQLGKNLPNPPFKMQDIDYKKEEYLLSLNKYERKELDLLYSMEPIDILDGKLELHYYFSNNLKKSICYYDFIEEYLKYSKVNIKMYLKYCHILPYSLKKFMIEMHNNKSSDTVVPALKNESEFIEIIISHYIKNFNFDTLEEWKYNFIKELKFIQPLFPIYMRYILDKVKDSFMDFSMFELKKWKNLVTKIKLEEELDEGIYDEE